MAELAASYTGTETVVANADGVVLELVGEAILAFGHGSDEYAYALLWPEVSDVVSDSDDGSIERQGHFAAVGRHMVGDWVLDDLQKLLL